MTAPVTDRPTADLPAGTLGGERKGLVEQVALVAFIAIPFVAILLALPVAWGGWLGWRDVVHRRSSSTPSPGHGITVGFHRYFTHGSFKAKRPLRVALAVAGQPGHRGPGDPLGRRPPQAPQVLRQGGRPALAVALRRAPCRR